MCVRMSVEVGLMGERERKREREGRGGREREILRLSRQRTGK